MIRATEFVVDKVYNIVTMCENSLTPAMVRNMNLRVF